MKKSGVLLLFVGVLLASVVSGIAIGGEQRHERKLQIAIDDGTGDGQLFIDMDGGATGIDLDDLQLGETRSLVDSQGRPILITRTGDGFELNVDGKQIELPNIDHPPGSSWAPDHDTDIDVDVTRELRIERVSGANGVTIISGKTIDEATRSGIRALLLSSGYDSEVIFVDGNNAAMQIYGTHNADQAEVRRHVKIISKEISATN